MTRSWCEGGTFTTFLFQMLSWNENNTMFIILTTCFIIALELCSKNWKMPPNALRHPLHCTCTVYITQREIKLTMYTITDTFVDNDFVLYIFIKMATRFCFILWFYIDIGVYILVKVSFNEQTIVWNTNCYIYSKQNVAEYIVTKIIDWCS